MDLYAAHNLAQDLLKHHGLTDWSFKYNERLRSTGLCDYRSKTIFLSIDHTLRREDHNVINTILHEIAHALVGPRVKAHGVEWYRQALTIGCNGERCSRD